MTSATRDAPERPGDGDGGSDDGAVARRGAARCSGGAAFGMRGAVLNGPGTAFAASSWRSIAASESPAGGAAGGTVAVSVPGGTVPLDC